MAVEVKVNTTGLDRGLRLAPGLMLKEMTGAVRDYGNDFTLRYARNRLRGRKGTNPGKGIDSTTLTRTFIAKTRGGSKIDDIESRIGWFDGLAVRIAAVHEFGTIGAGGELPTIVPRRAKALTIPLDAVKTAAGFTRGGADNYRENSFILRRPGRNALIVQKTGGGIVPLFVLVKKVDIPPRLNLRADFNSDAERKRRIRRMNKGITAALKKAGLKPKGGR